MHSSPNSSTFENLQPQAKRVRFEDNTATSTPFGDSIIKIEDKELPDSYQKRKALELRIKNLYKGSYKEDEGPQRIRYVAKRTLPPKKNGVK